MALRLISNPFPHVCISDLGSVAIIFHVDAIRETIDEDVIMSTPKLLIVPHDIIRAEFALSLMLVEALFQLVVNHKVGYLVKLLRHLNHYMSPEILALGIASCKNLSH